MAYFACTHGRDANRIKVAACKIEHNITTVPLVEQWRWEGEDFQIQYDAGSNVSLVWAETIQRIPEKDVLLGQKKTVTCAAFGAHLAEIVDIQEAELTFRGMRFQVIIIPNQLEGISDVSVRVPKEWQYFMLGDTLRLRGEVDLLLGQSLGRLYPNQVGSFEDFKMYRSQFTSGYMMFGAKDERSEVPNHISVKKFSGLEQISTELLKVIREEEFTTPSLKSPYEVEKKKSEVQEISDHVIINPSDNTVTGVYQYYEDKLKLLGTNEEAARGRAIKVIRNVSKKLDVAKSMDDYVANQMAEKKWVKVTQEEIQQAEQVHYVVYNFVESETSTSTKVRFVTDSSCRTESGLSLNHTVRDPPGLVQDMRGIIIRSRTADNLLLFDIKQFFRSIHLTTRDSMLRLMMIPSDRFQDITDTDRVEFDVVREACIPFGDKAAADYSISAKNKVVLQNQGDVPINIRKIVIDGLVKDCYVDDGSLLPKEGDDVDVIKHCKGVSRQ